MVFIIKRPSLKNDGGEKLSRTTDCKERDESLRTPPQLTKSTSDRREVKLGRKT